MTRAVRAAAFGGFIDSASRTRPTLYRAAAIGPTALIVLGAASFGAGVIHLAQGPAHVEELGGLGLGFHIAAALQLAWAAAAAWIVARGPTRLAEHPSSAAARHQVGSAHALVVAGIALNVAITGAWLVSRIVGLPAGDAPWTPEAIGRPDGIATVLETAIVVGLGVTLRGRRPAPVASKRRIVRGAALVALLLIASGTVVALGGAEEGHPHPPGYEHGSATTADRPI